MVSRLQIGGGRVASSILRKWRPGDTAKCRLCPECTAFADTCLVSTLGRVGKGEAAAFYAMKTIIRSDDV
jgi:hypothetical protein